MLTIHYQGSSEPKTMRKMMAELKAISEEVQWKYTEINDEDFIGILVTIDEECEPLSFIINKQGKLIHPAWLNHKNPPETAFFVSTKTNFSTIENHIVIVKLLRYIKKKYLPNLTITDEGDYYETGNKERLQQKRTFLLNKFDEVTGLLEKNFTADSKKLSPENLLKKIETIIQRNFGSDTDIQAISG